jgi:ATP-dependent helicase HepA
VNEIERLQALARVNPNVRAEEIEFMELQREALAIALDSASFRLDALRVVVAT